MEVHHWRATFEETIARGKEAPAPREGREGMLYFCYHRLKFNKRDPTVLGPSLQPAV
jgi:hypothetical protein